MNDYFFFSAPQLKRDPLGGAAVHRPVHRSLALLGVVVGLALSPFAVYAQSDVMTADSIVLERTRCYGTCPVYRLSVSRAGAVHFESRNLPDENRHATDTLHPSLFGRLVTKADLIEFLKLPDRIEDDARFCPQEVTDHPTAIVTVFMPSGKKRVEDYQGCFWAPVGLRELEDYIDEVTNAKRWIRPAPAHGRPPA